MTDQTDDSAQADYVADLPTFAIVDVETTGLDVGRHVVLELAAIIYEPNDVGDYHVFDVVELVPNHHLEVFAHAAPEAMAKNRYYERRVDKRTLRSDLTEDMLISLQGKLSDVTLVGANPAFDARFLDALIADKIPDLYTSEPPWNFRLLDVEALTMGLKKLTHVPGLTECANLWGIPVDPAQAHTALGDAWTTLRVLQACLGHPITPHIAAATR
ncbi:exonuclease domain-containing protein [Gordonia malaquae]|uniref:3'-5' exonuclease n=1 Tax=Gordonia malaquae TaxID=410332 RepID=UPI00301714CF